MALIHWHGLNWCPNLILSDFLCPDIFPKNRIKKLESQKSLVLKNWNLKNPWSEKIGTSETPDLRSEIRGFWHICLRSEIRDQRSRSKIRDLRSEIRTSKKNIFIFFESAWSELWNGTRIIKIRYILWQEKDLFVRIIKLVARKGFVLGCKAIFKKYLWLIHNLRRLGK